LFLQTLWRVGRADLGVDRDRVLLASFDLFQGGYDDARGLGFLQRLVADGGHLPGALSASVAMRLPFSVRGPVTAAIEVPGYAHHPDDVPFAEYNLVGPDYARTIGLPLLRGRDISEQDRRGSTPIAIVNQTMARRYWPNGDAVGRRFSILGQSVQIVGVARDGFYHSLTEAARPYVYLPIQQFYQPQATVLIRTAGDPAAVIQGLQSLVARMDPALPLYSIMPMRAYLGFAVVGQRTASVLLALFGALALFLASLGLYSALAYAVATRRREIGIRMALGGSRIDVVTLLIRSGTVVILAGVGGGVIAAAALARFVAAQVYGVSATDPLTYVTAAAIVALTAFLATAVPAIRASRADLTTALRYR
jgi:predicted permease